jgi:hypothetical protein
MSAGLIPPTPLGGDWRTRLLQSCGDAQSPTPHPGHRSKADTGHNRRRADPTFRRAHGFEGGRKTELQDLSRPLQHGILSGVDYPTELRHGGKPFSKGKGDSADSGGSGRQLECSKASGQDQPGGTRWHGARTRAGATRRHVLEGRRPIWCVTEGRRRSRTSHLAPVSGGTERGELASKCSCRAM